MDIKEYLLELQNKYLGKRFLKNENLKYITNDGLPNDFITPLPTLIKNIVKHQGRTPYCLTYSLSYIFELQDWNETGFFRPVSPDFLVMCNNPNGDETRNKKDLFKNVVDYGYVYDVDFEHGFDPITLDSPTFEKMKPLYDSKKDELLKKASKNKITKAYRCLFNSNERIKPIYFRSQDLKAKIMQYGAVQVDYFIFDSFYKRLNDIIIPKPDLQVDNEISNHSMTIIGWTKSGNWIILNSWGVNFGYNGIALIPEETLFSELNCFVKEYENGDFKKLKFYIAYENTGRTEMDATSIIRYNNSILKDPIFDKFKTIKIDDNKYICVYDQEFDEYEDALNFIDYKKFYKNKKIFILPYFKTLKYKLILDIDISNEYDRNLYTEIIRNDFGYDCYIISINDEDRICFKQYDNIQEALIDQNEIITRNPTLEGNVKVIGS